MSNECCLPRSIWIPTCGSDKKMSGPTALAAPATSPAEPFGPARRESRDPSSLLPASVSLLRAGFALVALEQFFPMLRPVLLQVSRQLLNRHSVDLQCPFVLLNAPQRPPHVLRFTYLLHQPFARSSAFGLLFRHGQFDPPVVRRSFTPRLQHEGQLRLVLLPLSTHESHSLLAFPFTLSFWKGTVRAFASSFPVLRSLAVSPLSGECPDRANRLPQATLPSADFWIAVRVSLDSLSPVSGTQPRSPEVSTTAFRTQPPDLRWASLMDMDFAVIGQLVRRLTPLSGFCSSSSCICSALPSDPVSRSGALALRYPSPPSGWWRTFTSELSYLLGTPIVFRASYPCCSPLPSFETASEPRPHVITDRQMR